jgi:hypothetical protein
MSTTPASRSGQCPLAGTSSLYGSLAPITTAGQHGRCNTPSMEAR